MYMPTADLLSASLDVVKKRVVGGVGCADLVETLWCLRRCVGLCRGISFSE